MTSIVTVLTEGFADWETALLNAVARSFYGVETHFASPGGRPVTSSGGMLVSPALALETLDPGQYDAIIVCGGSVWQTEEAPDLGPLLGKAKSAGIVVGLICDATVGAAKTGFLDTVAHTSNGAGYLDSTGYAGKGRYRDQASAVRDGKVITAGGTMPVSFMVEVMTALGLADDNLTFYAGMHGAEHPMQKAA